LRPGEKLFEEIRLDREALTPTVHEKIFRFEAAPEPMEEVRKSLGRLREEVVEADSSTVRDLISARLPEYQPPGSEAD